MLHFLYIIAFAAIASFAIANLFRNMMTLGQDVRQGYGNARDAMNGPSSRATSPTANQPTHPELLDESGKVVREPYLVLKSISVDDAREKLDAIYEASPGGSSSNNADDDNSEPVA